MNGLFAQALDLVLRRGLAVWLVTICVTGGASTVGLSQAALTFAAFSVMVGIGQMFVITLGPGNIDLSVPATMTLPGTVALKFMDDAERRWSCRGLAIAAAASASAVGHRQLRADQGAAHPADHRHAVDELHRPVRRDLDQPGPAHQAARGAGRFHHRRHARHAQYGAGRAGAVGAGLGAAAPHGLWPLDRGHRAKPARRAHGGHSGRWRAACDLRALRRAGGAVRLSAVPAFPAGRR